MPLESTDAEHTRQPVLPCVVMVELKDEIIELLATPIQRGWPYHMADVAYSMIPAIRRVREVTDLLLYEAKEMVEKISQEFAGQIAARKVILAQSKHRQE